MTTIGVFSSLLLSYKRKPVWLWKLALLSRDIYVATIFAIIFYINLCHCRILMNSTICPDETPCKALSVSDVCNKEHLMIHKALRLHIDDCWSLVLTAFLWNSSARACEGVLLADRRYVTAFINHQCFSPGPDLSLKGKETPNTSQLYVVGEGAALYWNLVSMTSVAVVT